jgi:hypothetical protein
MWAVAPLWVMVGCESAAVGTDAVTERDSAGVHVVENLGPTSGGPWHVDSAPLLVIGSAEADPDQALEQVTGAVRLAGQEIVVADGGQLELLFYDGSGNLMRRVGGRGGGPGEFESLEWLARYGTDSVVTLDVSNQRVSYFDTSGDFGRSVRLVSNADIPFPRAVGFFGDGSVLATRGLYPLGGEPPIRVERTTERLFRISADGSSAAEVRRFRGVESVIVPTGPGGRFERRRRPFGRETAFAVAGDRFYEGDNETYEIRAYSVDGQLLQIIRKQGAQRAITATDVRAFQDSVLSAASGADRQQAFVLLDRLPPHPETYPAFAGELRVDGDQDLWVRESTPPETQQSAWSVFSREGKLLGNVELPVRAKLLDVGTDYVLILRRDALDVEYVELYRLRRAP